jgi:hypothetical protein
MQQHRLTSSGASAPAVRRGARQRRGFLAFEAFFSFGLALATAGFFAYAVSRFNDHHDALLRRTAAVLAAESVMERLRAGTPWSPEAFAAAYPGLSCAVTRRPGDGVWQGCVQVTVEVRGTTHRRQPLTITLSGYLPPAEAGS